MSKINITIDAQTTELLSQIANSKHQSIAKTAKELMIEALSQHEDKFLSGVGDKRDQKSQKKVDYDPSIWDV